MHTRRYRIVRRLHLWLALPLALFLIVQGLTGSAIAWMHELDVFLNPHLLQVTAPHTEPQQPVSTVLARLNATPGYANPYMLELPQKKNEVLVAWYKATQSNVVRQVMVNPYTGAIMGERNWGEAGLSKPLLMPTLFHLHRHLLFGETGKIIVSINAILLAIIALTGLYLWWPVWRLKAWWQAITISFKGSWKSFNFRWHRAAGFYSAFIFLFMAVSGIYFNKPQWITSFITPPAIASFVTEKPLEKYLTITQTKPWSLEDILRAAQEQFPTAKITRVNLPKTSTTLYEIRLHQPSELRQRTGATRVTINSMDGRIIKVQDPLKAKSWDVIFSYFFPLHSGEVFGFIGKIIISLFGLMPLLFAISGTLIWLRRR